MLSRKLHWNARCDVCGFKYDANELKLRWDGMRVCEWDWEPRHPLDFYRTRIDTVALPFTRPDDNGIPAPNTNLNFNYAMGSTFIGGRSMG